VVLFPLADLSQIPNRRASDIESEVEFFNVCLNAVRKDIRDLHSKIAGHVAEGERQLFEVYLHMLDDDALGNEVVERIKQGNWCHRRHQSIRAQDIRYSFPWSFGFIRCRYWPCGGVIPSG
jgi:phosphotransferase system enzyme I (PtsP)